MSSIRYSFNAGWIWICQTSCCRGRPLQQKLPPRRGRRPPGKGGRPRCGRRRQRRRLSGPLHRITRACLRAAMSPPGGSAPRGLQSGCAAMRCDEMSFGLVLSPQQRAARVLQPSTGHVHRQLMCNASKHSLGDNMRPSDLKSHNIDLDAIHGCGTLVTAVHYITEVQGLQTRQPLSNARSVRSMVVKLQLSDLCTTAGIMAVPLSAARPMILGLCTGAGRCGSAGKSRGEGSVRPQGAGGSGRLRALQAAAAAVLRGPVHHLICRCLRPPIQGGSAQHEEHWTLKWSGSCLVHTTLMNAHRLSHTRGSTSIPCPLKASDAIPTRSWCHYGVSSCINLVGSEHNR